MPNGRLARPCAPLLRNGVYYEAVLRLRIRTFLQLHNPCLDRGGPERIVFPQLMGARGRESPRHLPHSYVLAASVYVDVYVKPRVDMKRSRRRAALARVTQANRCTSGRVDPTLFLCTGVATRPNQHGACVQGMSSHPQPVTHHPQTPLAPPSSTPAPAPLPRAPPGWVPCCGRPAQLKLHK